MLCVILFTHVFPSTCSCLGVIMSFNSNSITCSLVYQISTCVLVSVNFILYFQTSKALNTIIYYRQMKYRDGSEFIITDVRIYNSVLRGLVKEVM